MSLPLVEATFKFFVQGQFDVSKVLTEIDLIELLEIVLNELLNRAIR
jgi:hypothetical protein